MAITYVTNGVAQDVYCFGPSGYMYTIGPKNGIGKLYQPGTRGLVIDDSAKSDYRPNLTIKSSDNKVLNTGYGYFAKWTNNQRSVQTQSGGYSENLGLENLILNDSAYAQAKWYFPCTISEFSYDIDDSRYGDKPILGQYELINSGTYRVLNLPNTTIYKWEAHVVISTDYWSPNSLNTFEAYVPYYNSQEGQYKYIKLYREKIVDVSGSPWKYAYFSKEISTNLYNSSIMVFPVLYYTASADENRRFYVQTKFCFKDN